ncbi:cobalt ABC transporter permease [Brachybacterium endophyticum]|uniref:Cobalt ABC transporter permease n=1 Tax=Brachybacterium endophyticum TaxID=2182385 RepID=A0A2U2RNW1_9MICO|nr:energy-coupling factor transporter transmembrane component T [Brachybacterium endophyticum]PWH07562.1 cobalt ABC transporter permease [Brachybacterium endophyticum]
MVTLYRPGSSLWHLLATGRKALVLAALVLAISLLPQAWGRPTATIPAALCLACYAVPGIGLRVLLGQLVAMRWILIVTAVGQLIFLGPGPALVNTTRIAALISIAALLALTTRTTDLLDAMERGLSPLSRLRIDPQRVALLLAVTLNTVPALTRAAGQVREAQRARSARPSLRRFAVPFLILALKHADELGEALTARGVR